MSTAATDKRRLGSTGLEVSSVCIGTSPLASMERLYGYGVGEEQAVATVEAVFASSINFLDTSNGYGANGESEVRIGAAIRRAGLPEDFVLATKVDPAPGSTDFSGDRVRASVEESMQRLGIDHIQLLHLHDPERITFDEAMATDGPVKALVKLVDEGVVDYLGVAGGTLSELSKYVDTDIFDVVLNHNRYTLLNRSAEAVYQEARARGMGVLNAAPYGGGMLAKGPAVQPKYGYRERDSGIGDRAIAMQVASESHGVPLAAAALQFSVRSPLVDSTVVGVSSPQRVGETLELLATDIPSALWEELEALAPEGGWM